MKCYYFGCWNEPGHGLFAPGGRHVRSADGRPLEYAVGCHIDGALPPRRRTKRGPIGELCWAAQGQDSEGWRRITYDSEECPQGQFLRHLLPNGYTAISWWDRCQGDHRGACNSTVFLEGEHSTIEMLAALETHFPHVKANLDREGVKLVEVAS